jgi:hypothetical protein
MAERKWGAITDGARFEALVSTIIFFEDAKASLFGRPGKDGGQDARSGDGALVFQVKHHRNGSAAAAISDAKKEAAKIEQYREVGHPRHGQWKNVTHWRLVTNAEFNPTDRQVWDTKIVPLFTKQGLTADYWERQTLDALLDRHPEIHRSFFENETRVFLSLPEVEARLPVDEPFLRRDELGPFCGRQEEKERIREFLASDKFFLVIHGAGGTGKTRLLVEAGSEIASEGEWQVLWANVESMAATGAWFEAVVSERATVLLIDEPSDETLLQQLAEQLGGRVGRAAKWKVVIAVRSPKDPVLRFLRGARMKQRVEELPLAPLLSADAEEMCFQLLETGKRADLPDEVKRVAARQLSQRFARHPVWLTLAVQHLEEHGDLKRVPSDAEALADEYLSEIEKSQTDVKPESVRTMLRWVALLGTVNRQDDSAIKLIEEHCGITSVVDVRERLAALVRRRALSERGANSRFVELKPDVLRDHVLLRWLATDVGSEHPEPSDDAHTLLGTVRDASLRGPLNGLGRAILVALARTEFILRLSGHELPLIGGLLTALKSAVPRMSASQRLALTDVLEAVAPFAPRAAASLTSTLRNGNAPDETVEGIFETRSLGQAEVLLSLAWPLFGAAMGAESSGDREFVLRELCALASAEADLEPTLKWGLPNDGKRAASLVTRVLEGGPHFRSEYDDTAKTLCNELLTKIAAEPPTPGQVALLRALVKPVLALERRQSWNDDRSFSWRTFAIGPGSTAWTARTDVFSRVKDTLGAETTPIASRVRLWHVFADAHRNINRLYAQEKNDMLRTALLDNLKWTHSVLVSRDASDEIAAAREVWHWHHRFEKDQELKQFSVVLEDLYFANDLAKEFEPLLSNDDWRATEAKIIAKGKELAGVARGEDISNFLNRAVAFLGGDEKLARLSGIAWSLGASAESSAAAKQFIETSLKQPTIDMRSEFGVQCALGWIATIRKNAPARVHEVVSTLLNHCANDNRRANLLERIYAQVPRLHEGGPLTTEEYSLLLGSRELFTSTGRDAAFVAALALSMNQGEWSSLRALLEDLLIKVSPDQLPNAMRALVDATYWAVREDASWPLDLGEWLMSQLLALPDIDDLGDNDEWHLSEILNSVGKMDVRWLSGALARRQQQQAATRDGKSSRAASYNARFSKYVCPIAESDQTNDEVAAALNTVLDFVSDNGPVGYYLPEVLRDVDPNGLIVPTAVATRAKMVVSSEDVRRLARVGGAYALNGAPWRTIALSVIRATAPFGGDALQSVYRALGERGVRTWSGAFGEVPPIFIAAVTDAQAALEAESEPDLRPFWQHRLAIAEAELREQEERAKEERGE